MGFKKALLLASLTIFAGCTNGFQGLTAHETPNSNPQVPTPTLPADSVTPALPTPIVNINQSIVPTTDPQVAVTKVQEIQTNLSSDPQMSFSSEDLTLLESEGVISDKTAMKGWVQ